MDDYYPWHNCAQEKPIPLVRLLIITYDIGDRPRVDVGWYDTITATWITGFGRLERPVSHWACLPDMPGDTLTVGEVRRMMEL